MNILLDTNALIWVLVDSDRLGEVGQSLVADPTNEVFVSAASVWEIAIKMGLGKLRVRADVGSWLPDALALTRLSTLPISIAHAAMVEHLPLHHRDPFDRLLVAQAAAEALTIMTGDRVFDRYGVPVVRI